MTVLLVAGVYFVTLLLLRLAALFSPGMLLTVQILLIFYCLAGTTLVREVRMVFMGGCKWHVSLGVIRLRSRRRR